jgi:hypothetical protein
LEAHPSVPELIHVELHSSVSEANDLSGVVANDLSGLMGSQKGRRP